MLIGLTVALIDILHVAIALLLGGNSVTWLSDK